MKMQDEIMKERDSTIIALNNQAYIVYLKEVKAKKNKEGKSTTKTKAFVKKI